MITLYHGSPFKVEHPLVKAGRRNLDFGPGFYLTQLRDQAQKWATIICQRQKKQKTPLLNVYTFNLDAALKAGYRMLSFKSYDKAWLDFIVESRSGQQPWQGYDIIEGGVANDQVIEAIEAYLAGYASVETTLGRLIYAKPNHQICLLNQNMLDDYLEFKECVNV